MRRVTRCWEEATGEVLRASGPTALFGDRRYGRTEEDAHQYKHLEEPWRALHAAVVITLDVARRDSTGLRPTLNASCTKLPSTRATSLYRGVQRAS